MNFMAECGITVSKGVCLCMGKLYYCIGCKRVHEMISDHPGRIFRTGWKAVGAVVVQAGLCGRP